MIVPCVKYDSALMIIIFYCTYILPHLTFNPIVAANAFSQLLKELIIITLSNRSKIIYIKNNSMNGGTYKIS